MYPPPPRHGFVRAIMVTLASTVFGLSLMLNLYLLLFSGILDSGSLHTETTITAGAADQKIVVIPIQGIINDDMAQVVSRWLRLIEKDKNIKGVVLDVDTPGGGVTPSDEIYHAILRLRRQRQIPVAVAMGSLATSGGYYLSAGADWIIAQPTTLTGNIGVLMPRFNLSGLASKHGVQETTLTAPAEGFKNAGSMFQPEKPEETKYLQGIINQAYARFAQIVKEGRGDKLKDEIGKIANGQIFTAEQALKNGLIDDANGYREDAYDWVARQARLDKPHVVRYQRRLGMLDLLMSSRSGVDSPSARNVNVQLHLDARTIDELNAPRLMYLWRGD